MAFFPAKRYIRIQKPNPTQKQLKRIQKLNPPRKVTLIRFLASSLLELLEDKIIEIELPDQTGTGVLGKLHDTEPSSMDIDQAKSSVRFTVQSTAPTTNEQSPPEITSLDSSRMAFSLTLAFGSSGRHRKTLTPLPKRAPPDRIQ